MDCTMVVTASREIEDYITNRLLQTIATAIDLSSSVHTFQANDPPYFLLLYFPLTLVPDFDLLNFDKHLILGLEEFSLASTTISHY